MHKCFGIQIKESLPTVLSVVHLTMSVLMEECSYSILLRVSEQKKIVFLDFLQFFCQFTKIHTHLIMFLYFCLSLMGLIQLFILKKSNFIINLTLNLTFPIALFIWVQKIYHMYTDQSHKNLQIKLIIISLILMQILFVIGQFYICIRQTYSKNATKIHLNFWYPLLQYAKIHIVIILPFCGINHTSTFLIVLGISLFKSYVYKNSIIYEQALQEYIGYIGEAYSYMSLAKIFFIGIFLDSQKVNQLKYLPIIISLMAFLICFILLLKKQSPILVILQRKYSKFLKQYSNSRLSKKKKNNPQTLILFFSLIIEELFPNTCQEALPFSKSFKYYILECLQKEEETLSSVQIKMETERIKKKTFSIKKMIQSKNMLLESTFQSMDSQKPLIQNCKYQNRKSKQVKSFSKFTPNITANISFVQNIITSSEQMQDKQGLSFCLVKKIIEEQKKKNFIKSIIQKQNNQKALQLIWNLISLKIKKSYKKSFKKQFIYFICYMMSDLKESPKSKIFQTFYMNFQRDQNIFQKIEYSINHRMLFQKIGNLPQNASHVQKQNDNKVIKQTFFKHFSTAEAQINDSFKYFFSHNSLVQEIKEIFVQIVKFQQEKLEFYNKKLNKQSFISIFFIQRHFKKEELKTKLKQLKCINQLNVQYIQFSLLYELYVQKIPNFQASSSKNIQLLKKSTVRSPVKKIQYKNTTPICVVSGLQNIGRILSSNRKFKQLLSPLTSQNSRKLNVNEFILQTFQKEHEQFMDEIFNKYDVKTMMDNHSSNQNCLIVSKINNFHYEVQIIMHSYLRQISDYNFLIEFKLKKKLQSLQIKQTETNQIAYNYSQKNQNVYEQQNQTMKKLQKVKILRRNSVMINKDLSIQETHKTVANMFGTSYQITKTNKKNCNQQSSNKKLSSFQDQNKKQKPQKIIQRTFFLQDEQFQQKQTQISRLFYKKLKKNGILFQKLWPYAIIFPIFFIINIYSIESFDSLEDNILHSLKEEMNIFKFAEDQYLINKVYAPIDVLVKYKILTDQFDLDGSKKSSLLQTLNQSINLTNFVFEDLVAQVSSYDPQNTDMFYQMFYPNKIQQELYNNSTSYYMDIITSNFQFNQKCQILSDIQDNITNTNHLDYIQSIQLVDYLTKGITFFNQFQNRTNYLQNYVQYAKIRQDQFNSAILQEAQISNILILLTSVLLLFAYYRIKRQIYLFIEPIINLKEKYVKNIQKNVVKLKSSIQNFYSQKDQQKFIQKVQTEQKIVKTLQKIKSTKSVNTNINNNNTTNKKDDTFVKSKISFVRESFATILMLLFIFGMLFWYNYQLYNNSCRVLNQVHNYIEGEGQFVKYLSYSIDSYKILASYQYGNYTQISELYKSHQKIMLCVNQIAAFENLISDKAFREKMMFAPICQILKQQVNCTQTQTKKNFNIFMTLNENVGLLRFFQNEILQKIKNLQSNQHILHLQSIYFRCYESIAFIRKVGSAFLNIMHQNTTTFIINFDQNRLIISSIQCVIFLFLLSQLIFLVWAMRVYEQQVFSFVSFSDMKEIQQLNFYLNKSIDHTLKEKQLVVYFGEDEIQSQDEAEKKDKNNIQE